MADKDIGDRAIGRMGTDATPDLRREASELGNTARSAVEDSLSSARNIAAENVGRAGEALHAAAEHLGRNDAFGGLIDAAATQLDSASSALRDRDMNKLMHDAGDFARRQPALFIGGAVALGFALGRFATAGSRSVDYSTTRRTGATAGSTRTDPYSARSYSGGGLTSEPHATSPYSPTGPQRPDTQDTPLSSSVGGTRGDRHAPGEPSTTTPGQQQAGARPQPRGSTSGLSADE